MTDCLSVYTAHRKHQASKAALKTMTMIENEFTNLADFAKNYNAKKTQLVWHWIPADLITPCAAYLKLCGQNPYCFLFESVEGGNVLGRYSIIGLEPDLIWSCVDGESDVEIWHEGGSWELENLAPLDSLRELISACHIDVIPEELPPMAASGMFGYMNYDMIRLAEDIPDNNPDELGTPDSILMRPKTLAIFDNVKNMLCLVRPVYTHAGNDSDKAEDIYNHHIEKIMALRHTVEHEALRLDNKESKLDLPLEVASNTTEEEYKAMVTKAVEYINAGEIFQCVPSQRFSVDFDLGSFDLYRSLRRLNPSPFLFHLTMDNFALVGSSPEIMVRVRDETVTIRPIAGTRRRGKDAAEDKALAEDLLSDPKERAEHLMLLDLGRNDVGRVAEIGTVEVTDEFIVENYSHVMHIVSNVEGKLAKDKDGLEAFFSGFPAGTVSGAPKVRAMEIIDELEKSRRSFYAGAVGYFSGNGTIDTCIALRTALVKDGKVYIQSGAGVVADSSPESEYQETVNKAKALVGATENAIRLSKKKNF